MWVQNLYIYKIDVYVDIEYCIGNIECDIILYEYYSLYVENIRICKYMKVFNV